MFIIRIILISVLILIYQDILILTEETLILFCFILFIFMFYLKLKNNFTEYFFKKRVLLKKQILNSINLLNLVLNRNKIEKKKLFNWKKKIIQFKSEIKKNQDHLFKLQFLYKKNNMIKLYLKKLFFLKRIEKYVSILLIYFLILKIEKIITIKSILTLKFSKKKFIRWYKLYLFENFKKI
uniref:Atp4 n=1 Tax=Pterocladiophila hemisphaerica TaxID=2712948 RepID=A0A6M3WXT2_9FLOR|nr:Atp4 [Pterocladiophila hemisphaerica]